MGKSMVSGFDLPLVVSIRVLDHGAIGDDVWLDTWTDPMGSHGITGINQQGAFSTAPAFTMKHLR